MFFPTNVHCNAMIINSKYIVYKRGTKTTTESEACLPVTVTFTFSYIFKSVFLCFLFFSPRMSYGNTPQILL